MTDEHRYNVMLKDAGAKKHSGLARNALTDKRIHMLLFNTPDAAREAAEWMLNNNESLVSAKVVEADTRKAVWTS